MESEKNIINWCEKNLNDAIDSLEFEESDDYALNYLDEILSSLFVSILTDEYYFSSLKNCLSDIEKKYVEKISTSNVKISNDTKEIGLLIKFYFFFIKNIEDSLNKKFNDKKFNFELEYYYNKNNFIYENNESQETLLSWLFIVNLKISFLDEGYVVNDNNIALLWEIDHLLQLLISKENTSYIDLLNTTKLRANILLYKIIRRNEKANDESDFLIYNSSNNLEDFIRQQGASDIIDKIEEHYFKNKTITSKKLLNEIEEKINSDEIKIYEIISFTKYFRKQKGLEKKEIVLIFSIIERLKIKYRKAKINTNNVGYLEKINDFPCFSAFENLLNLEFSLKCNQNNIKIKNKFNFNNLEESYNNLKKIYLNIDLAYKEFDVNIPSFTIRKTYLSNLINLLEYVNIQDIENLNDEKNDFHKIISDILETAYITYLEFKKSVHFWENQRIMPLYLEIESCNNNGVFLDSYFVLPSNYDDVLNKIEKQFEKLEKLKVLLDKVIPKNIRENYKKVFENEVKDYKISIITIIGLYASFITYVLGNISLLKVFLYHSIGSVLAFMLVFGVVLSFFVVSLKILFSSIKQFRAFTILWFMVIIAMIFTALFLINEFKDVKISKETSKKIEYETAK